MPFVSNFYSAGVKVIDLVKARAPAPAAPEGMSDYLFIFDSPYIVLQKHHSQLTNVLLLGTLSFHTRAVMLLRAFFCMFSHSYYFRPYDLLVDLCQEF